MTTQHILHTLAEGILTITLNRPEKLNAFTATMRDELIDAFDRADADDAVRVVVITGAGRGFCAGADLSGRGESFDAARRSGIDPGLDGHRDGGGQVTLRMYECLKPILVACNGPAVGIGATLQLAADIRLASSSARYGFVFTRRGIVMEACSSWFLPRLVGMQQAMEWVSTGRVFSAEEALAGRLVRSVHAPEALLPAAYALAREIAEHTAPVSVALNRQMMWKMLGADHPMEAHRIDSKGIYALGATADVREGVESFLDKRAPAFPGKVSRDLPKYFPWWRERGFD
ncbi:MAG: crotonase/enoyl-CoA hydratase family protein [Proteobacteria bacterium]|nr:crotonase/enoyl-CoA hydratase family protein [Pseudomonadota bacterium]